MDSVTLHARVERCVFDGNQVPTSGGAVSIVKACLPSLVGSEFRDNVAKANGGAIVVGE